MAVMHALAAPALAAPGLGQTAAALAGNGSSTGATGSAAKTAASGLNPRAHAAAVNFEAQFLNSMFSQMFAGVQGDGPFGGGPAVGVWRSFLSDQYAKSFAKAGGIGIADKVYHTLLAHQEAHAG
jgi:Rod binding domain-containing protein